MSSVVIGGENFDVGLRYLEDEDRKRRLAMQQQQMMAEQSARSQSLNLQREQADTNQGLQWAKLREDKKRDERDYAARREDALFGQGMQSRQMGNQEGNSAFDHDYKDRSLNQNDEQFGYGKAQQERQFNYGKELQAKQFDAMLAEKTEYHKESAAAKADALLDRNMNDELRSLERKQKNELKPLYDEYNDFKDGGAIAEAADARARIRAAEAAHEEQQDAVRSRYRAGARTAPAPVAQPEAAARAEALPMAVDYGDNDYAAEAARNARSEALPREVTSTGDELTRSMMPPKTAGLRSPAQVQAEKIAAKKAEDADRKADKEEDQMYKRAERKARVEKEKADAEKQKVVEVTKELAPFAKRDSADTYEKKVEALAVKNGLSEIDVQALKEMNPTLKAVEGVRAMTPEALADRAKQLKDPEVVKALAKEVDVARLGREINKLMAEARDRKNKAAIVEGADRRVGGKQGDAAVAGAVGETGAPELLPRELARIEALKSILKNGSEYTSLEDMHNHGVNDDAKWLNENKIRREALAELSNLTMAKPDMPYGVALHPSQIGIRERITPITDADRAEYERKAEYVRRAGQDAPETVRAKSLVEGMTFEQADRVGLGRVWIEAYGEPFNPLSSAKELLRPIFGR